MSIRRAECSGDRTSLANLHALYGAVRQTLFNDLEGHLELARQSVRLADETGHLETRLDAFVGLVSVSRRHRGPLAEAVECANRALELVAGDRLGSSGLWHWDPALYIAVDRAAILSLRGQLHEARRELEGLERLVQQSRQLPLVMYLAQSRAENAQLRGDAQVALEQARRMVEHSEWFEGTLMASLGHANLGRAHLLAGRLDETLAEFAQWEAVNTSLGAGRSVFVLVHLPYVAQAHRRAGDLRRAHAIARECVETTRARKMGETGAQAEIELARVLLARDGPTSQAFARALSDAESLVEEIGARVFEPHLHELRAESAALQGESDERQRELREAQRLFREMGATGHEERVARELEGLSA